MADCVIFIGLPASGKTTFYQRRFSATHRHISKDHWPPSATRSRDRVPDAAIFTIAKRMVAPRMIEGFDELYHVSIGADNEFVVAAAPPEASPAG